MFWYAAGLGDDEESRPERSEHFGALTVLRDRALCDRMAAAARLRAQRFGRETFDRRLLDLVRGPGDERV